MLTIIQQPHTLILTVSYLHSKNNRIISLSIIENNSNAIKAQLIVDKHFIF
jgi:hypothetical protein